MAKKDEDKKPEVSSSKQKNKSTSESKTKSKKPKNEINTEEDLLTSQKEINATLEMLIRSFKLNEDNENCEPPEDNDQNDEECNDSNDTDDDLPPKIRRKKKFIPIPQGGVNLFLTCVDVFVFELDEDILEKLILCAIISMSLDTFLCQFKTTFFPRKTSSLHPLEQQLDEKISSIYNQTLLQVMSGIQQTNDKKEYLKKLFQTNLLGSSKYLNLLDLLSSNVQCLLNPLNNNETEEIHKQFEQTIRSSALSFLYNTFARKLAEFQHAVGIKVNCIETDLTFLSTEILRFTSAEAGILQLANSLTLVVSARFAEDDEFDEIFDAVEELADTIEDLAEIYRDRLKVLRALLPFSLCPRPLICPKKTDDDNYIE